MQKMLTFQESKVGPFALAAPTAELNAGLRALLRHPFNSEKRRRYLSKQRFLLNAARAAVDLPDLSCDYPAVLAGCAVHIHAYYPAVLDEILSVFGPVSRQNIHVKVTVVQPPMQAFAINLLREKGFGSFCVDVVPNIGRDLGPLFTECVQLFKDFKYVAHLHTKRSSHSAFGDDWRRYLVSNVVGSDDCIRRQIAYLEHESNCGVLYPQNYTHSLQATYSKGNVAGIAALLRRLDPSWTYELRDFPAGSMCWLRSDAFSPILDRMPPIQSYDPELGQIDGTLAHAIERCLTLIPHKLGYSCVAFRA